MRWGKVAGVLLGAAALMGGAAYAGDEEGMRAGQGSLRAITAYDFSKSEDPGPFRHIRESIFKDADGNRLKLETVLQLSAGGQREDLEQDLERVFLGAMKDGVVDWAEEAILPHIGFAWNAKQRYSKPDEGEPETRRRESSRIGISPTASGFDEFGAKITFEKRNHRMRLKATSDEKYSFGYDWGSGNKSVGVGVAMVPEIFGLEERRRIYFTGKFIF